MSEVHPEHRWVVQNKYRNAGRIGQIHAVYAGKKPFIAPRYVVQFGSGGPYCRLSHGSLRKAEPEEVAQVMGCRVRDLPEGYLV